MDAPFRETEIALENAKDERILAVEMEAAALYIVLPGPGIKKIRCFADVTNQMEIIEGDFEKGEANSTWDVLKLIATAAWIWMEGSGSCDLRK